MKEIEFKEFVRNNCFILMVLYNGNQIGTIKQNDNSEFYAEFHKGNFHWLDHCLKYENENKSFDLDKLKSSIVSSIKEVFDCF